MTSTLDRLRRLNSLRPLRGAARDIDPSKNDGPRSRIKPLEGQEASNASGTCFVAEHVLPISTLHGQCAIGDVFDYTPSTIGGIFPALNVDNCDTYQRAVFLDTETTGLGTGASVYAFMIGLGVFESRPEDLLAPCDTINSEMAATAELGVLHDPESLSQDAQEAIAPYPDHPSPHDVSPTHFVVYQYFMRSPAEETALLDAVASRLAGKELVVTFNGNAFDLPLLRSRLRYNRPFLPETVLFAPLLKEGSPHIDLLAPARRLWRRRLQSCRLANLEQMVLGLERTQADVPGHLIPRMYADYLQSGDTREMERVFYHNREDIVSMVSLTTALSEAFTVDARAVSGETLPGQDWMSLAMTYERMDDAALAEPAYLRALEANLDYAERAEAFLRLGRLRKRQGRWQEAYDTWQLWLTSVPGNDPAPYIELAKYCEWRLQDYDQAEMWTAWALHNLRQVPSEIAWSRTIRELEHRLQRIRSKKPG